MEPIITEIVGLVLKGNTMELGKRFTEGAIAKIGTLRQFIITRLQGKPKAKEAIAQLEAGSEEALTSDQLPVTSYQLPVTSYQLPVTSYQAYGGSLKPKVELLPWYVIIGHW